MMKLCKNSKSELEIWEEEIHWEQVPKKNQKKKSGSESSSTPGVSITLFLKVELILIYRKAWLYYDAAACVCKHSEMLDICFHMLGWHLPPPQTKKTSKQHPPRPQTPSVPIPREL